MQYTYFFTIKNDISVLLHIWYKNCLYLNNLIIKVIEITTMKKIILSIFVITTFVTMLYGIEIQKDLSFKRHSLKDNYTYKNNKRIFQWDKISTTIDYITTFKNRNDSFGILKNYKNSYGHAPLTSEFTINEYYLIEDNYGVLQYQGIPLYTLDDDISPKRYSLDGSLVALVSKGRDFYTIEHATIKGIWRVPKEYFYPIRAKKFEKIIFIDKTNQNIATLEYDNSVWYVKSMNPATTGKFAPPYKRKTPKGIFMFQNIKPKMGFYKDGTTKIGGFAPYASRFSGGAYIHGVPINFPDTELVEYSRTLGTVPLSHMCVRNATSHAKFIYHWGRKNRTLIIVIE